MSKFKDILDIALEFGYAGETYSDTVEYIKNSSLKYLLDNKDYGFDGEIYKNYIQGKLETF